MEMKMIDQAAKTWFVNIGAFRLPHPFREGVIFDPAIKYLVEADDWIHSQPTLVPTTVDEDTSDVQMHPTQPGSPQFDKAADDAAAQASVDKYIAEKKPELIQAKKASDKTAAKARDAELAARVKAEAAETAKQTGTAPAEDSKPAEDQK